MRLRCFSCGGSADHVKLMFIHGSEVTPVPPVTSLATGKATRGVDISSLDEFDERRIAAWILKVSAMPGLGGRRARPESPRLQR